MRKTQSYNSGDTKVDLTEDSNTEVDSSIDDTIPLMNQQGPVVHQQEPFAWLGDMKRKYLGYREVDIPPWLEDNDFYKLGDWKAFKKPRNNGGEEWKYAHRVSRKMFHNRNKAEDFLVRISSQGSELYDDEQLQKRAAYTGGQSSGNSSRSRKAKGRGRASVVSHAAGNSSGSNKAFCTRGSESSAVYRVVTDKLDPYYGFV